ncbi:hypothetical protein PX52LOC_08169 [Limnoglobus roseus]|uniref:DUF4328 domain-containing protein n=1 Tax=Limnoglobus roseus TaxID=2598579 RepID=A0A5C1APX4_9BACT|nr:hypothetical protein PX52LOC_08169 [Limnoglobus roseus]
MFAQFDNDGGASYFFMMLLVIIGVVLAIQILFLLNLSRCLQQISPRNRDIEPGSVWLWLVPFVNLVWMFIVVNRVSSSLKNEYRDRGWRVRSDFGSSVGLTYCGCVLASIIPVVGAIFGLIALVCFCIYYRQIAGYKTELVENSGPEGDDRRDEGRSRRGSRRYADEDDDYDDRRDRRDRRGDRYDDDYDDRRD